MDSFTSSFVSLGELLGLSEPRLSHLGKGTVLRASRLAGTLAEVGTRHSLSDIGRRHPFRTRDSGLGALLTPISRTRRGRKESRNLPKVMARSVNLALHRPRRGEEPPSLVPLTAEPPRSTPRRAARMN